MLHMIWFAVLVLVAIVGAAGAWMQLSNTFEDSGDSVERALLWTLVMLGASVLAVALQHDALVTGLMRWWMAVLPEPNSGLNLVTAGLLTFVVWIALLLGIAAAGAGIAEACTRWGKRRRAHSLAANVIERAARFRSRSRAK